MKRSSQTRRRGLEELLYNMLYHVIPYNIYTDDWNSYYMGLFVGICRYNEITDYNVLLPFEAWHDLHDPNYSIPWGHEVMTGLESIPTPPVP